MYSFIDPCLDGIKDSIGKGGQFLSLSKDYYLAKVYNQFYSLREKGIKHVFTNRGICLDSLSGSDVLEFIFSSEDCSGKYSESASKKLGDNVGENETLFCFAIEFRDDKNCNISNTKRFSSDLNYRSNDHLSIYN